MRLTPIGKLILLILIVGAALGGYRALSGKGGLKLPSIGGKGGKGGNGSNGNGSGGDVDNGGTNGGGDGANGGDIVLVASETKKSWLQDQIARFNEQNAGKYQVKANYIETRDAMHSVLDGKIKPVLWSPSSTIWTTRLVQVWKQKTGQTLVDTNDSGASRIFLRSPLVWMTTRDKAAFLRPILSSANAWSTLRRLNIGQMRAPYGRFKWSHSDPLLSNSGFLTMGMILADYADRTGQSDNLDAVARSKAFASYLTELERNLVRDKDSEGSSSLTKAFVQNPGRYDLITTYESLAIGAARDNPNLVVIYPNPTAVSEHAVSVIDAAWVSPDQKAGARAFLQFLGSETSLQAGMANHMRPSASSSLSLASELSDLKSQGFQQTFSSLELPSFTALNQAAFVWRTQVAKQPA